MTEPFKDVALRVLREAAAACPAQGAVPDVIVETMTRAAIAATALGATLADVEAAMDLGYLEHDMEEAL